MSHGDEYIPKIFKIFALFSLGKKSWLDEDAVGVP